MRAAVHHGSRPEGQAGLQDSLCPWGEACTDTRALARPLPHTLLLTRPHTLRLMCTPVHTDTPDTHIHASRARTHQCTPLSRRGALGHARARSGCSRPRRGQGRGGCGSRRGPWGVLPSQARCPLRPECHTLRRAPAPPAGRAPAGPLSLSCPVLSLGRGLLPLLVTSELRQRRGSHVHSRAWGWHMGHSQHPGGSGSPPSVALSPRAWWMPLGHSPQEPCHLPTPHPEWTSAFLLALDPTTPDLLGLFAVILRALLPRGRPALGGVLVETLALTLGPGQVAGVHIA